MGRETFRYASNFSQDGAELHYKNKYIFCFLLFHFITFLVTLLKSGRVWNTWVWHRFSVRPKISWKALTLSTYYPSLHMSGPRKVANKSLWRILTPMGLFNPNEPQDFSKLSQQTSQRSCRIFFWPMTYVSDPYDQGGSRYKNCGRAAYGNDDIIKSMTSQLLI